MTLEDQLAAGSTRLGHWRHHVIEATSHYFHRARSQAASASTRCWRRLPERTQNQQLTRTARQQTKRLSSRRSRARPASRRSSPRACLSVFSSAGPPSLRGEAYRAPARSAATPRGRPRDEGSRGPPPGKRAHRGLSQIRDHGTARREDERRAGAICPRARNVEKAQLSSRRHLLVLTVSRSPATAIDGAVIAAPSIPDAGSSQRPRVLLADDHPAMLALTVEALAGEYLVVG